MSKARKASTAALTVATIAGLALGLGPIAASAQDGRDGRDGGHRDGGGYDSDDSYGQKLRVVGLAGDRTLVLFDTNRPGRTRQLGDVKGLRSADTKLVGIDYRVQDGKLYGVGNGGGVYTIDPANQQATFALQLTIALEGTAFGVDFNPAANALRVISDTGQNLRQPFATAGASTVADGRLSSPPAMGDTTGVTGAAYTNNDTDASTATTLYDLATGSDQVVIQSPANAGTLVATGSLRKDFKGDTGFDIYSRVRDNRAVELFPYAVNEGRLYSITLFNGDAKDLGRIGGGATVVDLAIPLNQL